MLCVMLCSETFPTAETTRRHKTEPRVHTKKKSGLARAHPFTGKENEMGRDLCLCIKDSGNNCSMGCLSPNSHPGRVQSNGNLVHCSSADSLCPGLGSSHTHLKALSLASHAAAAHQLGDQSHSWGKTPCLGRRPLCLA